MRKTIADTMAAIAAFILIFCIAFTVVKITAQSYSYMEDRFLAHGIDTSTGISTTELSLSYQALIDYMNGKTDSIDTYVMLNGERTAMYSLAIEHTHMEEVRSLWQRITSLWSTGLLFSVLLFVFSMLLYPSRWRITVTKGYLWGFSIVLLIFAFFGTWAGISFDSFWNFFHRVIFPNSESWQLPASSRMVQMLTSAVFSDIVGRCALFTLLPSFLLAGGSIYVLLRTNRKTRTAAATAKAEEKEKVQEEAELIVGEPDLVLVHEKVNMPVSRRKALNKILDEQREAEKTKLIRAEEEEPEIDDAFRPDGAALQVSFAPYVPEEAPEEDNEGFTED